MGCVPGPLPAFWEGPGYEASEIIDSTFLSLKTNMFMHILVTTVYSIADILTMPLQQQ